MNRWNRSFYFRAFFFALLLIAHAFIYKPTAGHPGQTIIIDADRQFEYAEAAFNKGEYDRAINEYRRFSDFFPQDTRVRQAGFQIGMAYLRATVSTKPLKHFNP